MQTIERDQATVVSVQSNPGGTYVDVGTAVDIVAGTHFESGTTIEDMSVTVEWGKLGPAGTCPTDPTAALPVTTVNAHQEETLLKLVYTGTAGTFERVLAAESEFTGDAPHLPTVEPADDDGYVTVTWQDGGDTGSGGSYGFPGDESPLEPQENPFSDMFFNEAPFGTWTLQAATQANRNPICIRSWTLQLSVRQPRADVDATPDTVGEGTPVFIDMSCSEDQGTIINYDYDCDNSTLGYTDNDASNTASCTYYDEGTGSYTVQVRVTDDDGASGGPMTDTDTVDVTVSNVAPTISLLDLPGAAAYPYQAYDDCYSATDPGNDALDFSLASASAGLAIYSESYIVDNGSSGSACMRWDTPACADIGDNSFSIVVEDEDLATDEELIGLAVTDVDDMDACSIEGPGDGIADCADNCPFDCNVNQNDLDGDGYDLDQAQDEGTGTQARRGGDFCDGDDDNDGRDNVNDDCDADSGLDEDSLIGLAEIGPPNGVFISYNVALDQDNLNDDWDTDGCKDADVNGYNEDEDDDDDGVLDLADDCDPDELPAPDGLLYGEKHWDSETEFDTEGGGAPTDFDGDGCQDEDGDDVDSDDEDDDDDGDGVADAQDLCDPDIDDVGPTGAQIGVGDPQGTTLGELESVRPAMPFTALEDHDDDGCEDATEDPDDDNDGRADAEDDCDPDAAGGDIPEIPNMAAPDGFLASQANWDSTSPADYDADGCRDDHAEDGDDDNDAVGDTLDLCDPDAVVTDFGTGGVQNSYGYRDGFVSAGGPDYDGDGCLDDDETVPDPDLTAEDSDDDNDGNTDVDDACDPDDGTAPGDANDSGEINSEKNWTSTQAPGVGTDWDDDGCKDEDGDDLDTDDEDDDDDNDAVQDGDDDCDADDETDEEDTTDDGNTEGSVGSDLGWTSSTTPAPVGTDWDGDGCQDGDEDADDDADRQLDGDDDCDPDDEGGAIFSGGTEGVSASNTHWNSSTAGADYDNDGCNDATTEDPDDDNDRSDDAADDCDPTGFDGLGLWNPNHTASDTLWDSSSTAADYDQDGCQDTNEDTDDDDDVRLDGNDSCDQETLPAISSELHWLSQLPDGCTVQTDGPNVYLACSGAQTWQNARHVCQGLGGDLVNIDHGVENTYVSGLAETVLGAANPWIGGHDQFGAGSEGQWVWVDTGEQFWSGGIAGFVPTSGSYANWVPGGEPNEFGEEDCAQIYGNGSDQWNDANCASTIAFICELPVAPATNLDYDADGCRDEDGADAGGDDEDEDDDADLVTDANDICDPDTGTDFDTSPRLNDSGPNGNFAQAQDHHPGVYLSNIGAQTADHDLDGCDDVEEDGDDDNDSRPDASDDCDVDDETSESNTTADGNVEDSDESTSNWDSSSFGEDWDQDGCKDKDLGAEDSDDDSDQVLDGVDDCDPEGFTTPEQQGRLNPPLVFSPPHTNSDRHWEGAPGEGLDPPGVPTDTDFDDDGCQDDGEDTDDDDDQQIDGADDCDPDGYAGLSRDTLFFVAGASVRDWDSSQTTPLELDHDDDGCRDDTAEDKDDDNDGYGDDNDRCPNGVVDWPATDTDYDSDGCQDYTNSPTDTTVSEDADLDNDGVFNVTDRCDPTDLEPDGVPDALLGFPAVDIDDSSERFEDGFVSNILTTDRDGDGCKDQDYGLTGTEEDPDDDNDGMLDAPDTCDPDSNQLTSDANWPSSLGVATSSSAAPGTDYDGDGCQDSSEDPDDDNDGSNDPVDLCDPDLGVPAGEVPDPSSDPNGGTSEKGWTSDNSTDPDGDGCLSPTEDPDRDNDGVLDAADPDSCEVGVIGDCVDYTNDGCCDVVPSLNPQDSDDDDDGNADVSDPCDPSSGFPTSSTGLLFTDYDDDGCEDDVEDTDNDADTVPNGSDDCDTSTLGFDSDNGTGTPGNDYNNDGCADAGFDDDDDNDGILDAVDRCDPDATLPSTSPGAGLPDADLGVLASVKGPGGDYDGDGCKDGNIDADPDDDDDGRLDGADLCDPDPSGPAGDYGVSTSDTGPGFDSTELEQDNDSDGCSEEEDPDDDNDGVLDSAPDNCPLVPNPGQEDIETIGGPGDACDGDVDGDGVDDGADNCPSVPNPAPQTNTDNDSEGNACDDDDDNDEVDDGDDNCPVDANGASDESDQVDLDGDGDGDVCDEDQDGDGLLNIDEDCEDDPETGTDECAGDPLAGLDGYDADSDDDGIDDGTEVGDDVEPPPDGDGFIDEGFLSSPRDTDNGIDETTEIDALDDDSDQDTYLDEEEAGDPDTDDPFPRDTDDDGTPDYRDTDSDNDESLDIDDNCLLVSNDQDDDADEDGAGDACDDDADNDGLSNDDEENVLGTDPLLVDTDGDGVDDPTEVGPDVLAALNTDGLSDGIDAIDEDSDEDGIDDAVENVASVPFPANTDNDAYPNYRDTDSDNDGIGDVGDNCYTISNPNQLDDNMDGQGDACDDDTDGDGVPNASDNCPNDPNPGSPQLNTDVVLNNNPDGLGDACDADDDGDGDVDVADNCALIPNANQRNTDEFLDNNPDDLGDVCDPDDDGDGVDDGPDNCDLTPNGPLPQLDTNTDGEGDACDTDDDGDGDLDGADNCPLVSNADQLNYDSDSLGDLCDPDDDNDLVLDDVDTCDTNNTADQTDTDEDGFGNPCDPDDDNDEVDDGDDNCPLDANDNQRDTDDDGDGDACDGNDDNDSESDRNDNCPTVANDDQDDLDGDDVGDACDDDDDDDGVDDDDDNCPTTENDDQDNADDDDDGDACDDDDDNDGIPDDEEDEDAGSDEQPTPDAGPSAGSGAGTGGRGGAGGAGGTGAPDAGGTPVLVACEVEAIVDAVGGELPDVLTRQTVLAALRDADVAVPDDAENPTADDVEEALEDEGVLIPDDCDLEALLDADAITKRKPDDGCGCATVGAPSEHGGTRAALLAGLALALGYRRRRRAA